MQQGALALASGAGFAEGRWLVVFRRALLRAQLARLLGCLTGRRCRLLHLGTIMKAQQLVRSYHGGVRAVRLDRIRGSEGRCEDFDVAFRPTNERNRKRWMRVALAHLRGTPLPAVDLVQVGDVYFVRDGHHRVSVARCFGQQTIDAQITVWEVTEAAPSLAQPAKLWRARHSSA